MSTTITVAYGNFEFSGSRPLVEISEQANFDGAGVRLFSDVSLRLNGTFLPSGEQGLSGIYQQINHARNAFSQDYRLFVIKEDSRILESGYPIVNAISFEPNPFVTHVKYSIDLFFRKGFSGVSGVESFNDNFSFEEQDDGTLALSHEVEAKGFNTQISGSSNAFINAKNFVILRTSTGTLPLSAPYFTSQVSNSQITSTAKSERINEREGTYGISERFVQSSGNYVENYSIQVSEDENNIISTAINGEIRGLGSKAQKYDRAYVAWTGTVSGLIYSRCSSAYSDFGGIFTLNTSPLSQTFTSDQFNGTISYSRSFSDEKIISLPSGVVDFQISVSDNPALNVTVSIPVPGRESGNIVQSMLTATEFSRSVNGFMRVDRAAISGGLSGAKLATQFIKNELNKFYRPSGNGRTDIRVTAANFSEREEISQSDYSVSWLAIESRPTGDLSIIP